MNKLKSRRKLLFGALSLLAILSVAIVGIASLSNANAAGVGNKTLKGSASPWTASKSAHLLHAHAGSDVITFGLYLSNGNVESQQALLKSLYTPGSAQYHNWLSSGQFSAQYAPSASTVAAAQSFATKAGLKVLPSSYANLLLVQGKASTIEQAFHTQIADYNVMGGTYYGASKDLQVPTSLSNVISGVVGLSNIPVASPNIATPNSNAAAAVAPYGGGPLGSGLTPSQIAGIYNSSTVYSKLKDQGQGSVLALYELAGYKASDITKYENQYHLPHVKLVNEPVLGGASSDNGASEVELDIELQIAMAPKVQKILVYEAPNTELGALSEYLQIAKDNKADAISTSWGIICEYVVNSEITLAENQTFLQIASQGQSLFAAAGDAGAYGCSRAGLVPPAGQELQIGDPNNQPYVTAVGGTSFREPNKGTILFDPGQNAHPKYPGTSKEGTWDEGCTPASCEGGGGGISRVWAEPDYAANLTTGVYYPGVINSYSESGTYCGQQGGVLCRENPDVSMDADPGTGYSVYCTDPGDSFCATGEFGTPGWVRLGGTSCAAPLWAGIAALADSHHKGRLGLFNYIVYPFDSTSGYKHQFHDITLFTNGYYPATADYDLATGIGTPDIYQLVK